MKFIVITKTYQSIMTQFQVSILAYASFMGGGREDILANFPIGLHVILELQIKKIKTCLTQMHKIILTKNLPGCNLSFFPSGCNLSFPPKLSFSPSPPPHFISED